MKIRRYIDLAKFVNMIATGTVRFTCIPIATAFWGVAALTYYFPVTARAPASRVAEGVSGRLASAAFKLRLLLQCRGFSVYCPGSRQRSSQQSVSSSGTFLRLCTQANPIRKRSVCFNEMRLPAGGLSLLCELTRKGSLLQ